MSKNTCGECCHLERLGMVSFRCKHCNGTVSIGSNACNHFSKQYGICPECGSYLFSYEHTEDNDWQLCTCERCGCSGTPDEFLYNSVFARITASLEALAEKLVYSIAFDYCYEEWYSTLFPDKDFGTKAEAIAATVEKLKEVEK